MPGAPQRPERAFDAFVARFGQPRSRYYGPATDFSICLAEDGAVTALSPGSAPPAHGARCTRGVKRMRQKWRSVEVRLLHGHATLHASPDAVDQAIHPIFDEETT
jgi:hypothetical protein